MTPLAPAAAGRDDFLGHPKGVYVCFFTEMWERFSFYGMKALLLLYLLQHHRFGDSRGLDILGAYGGLVYCLPVIGGMLADRWLGMRKAVVFGGVLLVLGHLGMTIEGTPATVQQLREVGEHLVDIHGQHAHQSLLRSDAQRQLLDAHAGLEGQVRAVGAAWRQWRAADGAWREASTQAEALGRDDDFAAEGIKANVA